MSLVARLRLAALASVIGMLVLAGLVFQRAGQVSRHLEDSGSAMELLEGLGSLRYLSLEYLQHREGRISGQWESRHATLQQRLARVVPATAEEEQTLHGLRTDHARLAGIFTELTQIPAVQPGADAAATALRDELERRLSSQIIVLITKMNAEVTRLLRGRRAELASQMAAVRFEVLAAGGGLAVILACVIALLTRRMVSVLGRMREGVRVLASGDLDHRLDIRSNDELGRLAAAFDDMAAALKSTTLSRDELVNGAGIVVRSAAELLATATQVSASSAEATAAVTQTSATVEQVRRTAQQSSERALAVSEGAKRAEAVAQAGREAVEQVLQGMHQAQEQMQALAQSIVQLSERNQAIGEIIEAARDVASQSNVLAVNAAIEAAQAGEHGKGFAVVAHEVRALADQSRRATVQVGEILREIQEATAAAVERARQGTLAVAAGLDRSAEADSAIRTLAEQVVEAARSAIQIAASSREQVAGMDDVAAAMTSIMESSTQNASGIRQVEESARDLDTLGRKLNQVVAQNRA